MINLNYMGSDYGGWFLSPDLIPESSTIISAGVGEDITFDLHLINLKSCSIIGVDPTPKSHDFIASQDIPNFHLIKKALIGSGEKNIKIFKQKNPEYVSESILSSNQNSSDEFHICDTITLNELLSLHPDASVIKMDIEGAEYEIIENIKELKVPQLCIEFHHFCTHFTEKDTLNCLKKLHELGYTMQHTPNGKEYTFVRYDQDAQ